MEPFSGLDSVNALLIILTYLSHVPLLAWCYVVIWLSHTFGWGRLIAIMRFIMIWCAAMFH